MAIENPNIPDRSNTNFFTGPIGAGTVLTAPIFVEGDLPTADPLVAGQVWVDSTANFVLKVSQG